WRRPGPRPDVNYNEDPDQLFLAADNRSHLIGLRFYHGETSYFSIVEPTTLGGCSPQPTMHRIPCNSLDSRDGGLIQALGTESRDGVKRRTTVVESIIRCPGC